MRELPSENFSEATARAHGQIVPPLRKNSSQSHSSAGLRLFKALFRGPTLFLVEDHAVELIIVKVVALVHGGTSSWRREAR